MDLLKKAAHAQGMCAWFRTSDRYAASTLVCLPYALDEEMSVSVFAQTTARYRMLIPEMSVFLRRGPAQHDGDCVSPRDPWLIPNKAPGVRVSRVSEDLGVYLEREPDGCPQTLCICNLVEPA